MKPAPKSCHTCIQFKQQANQSGTCYLDEPARVPVWHVCPSWTAKVILVTRRQA